MRERGKRSHGYYFIFLTDSTVLPEMSKTAHSTHTTAKPPSGGRQKATASALGAPSQHNQGSRKGKRAWRKNVDLQDVEEGMEGLRAEERLTGYAQLCIYLGSSSPENLYLCVRSILQKKTDEQLFQIDTTGDEHGASCILQVDRPYEA